MERSGCWVVLPAYAVLRPAARWNRTWILLRRDSRSDSDSAFGPLEREATRPEVPARAIVLAPTVHLATGEHQRQPIPHIRPKTIERKPTYGVPAQPSFASAARTTPESIGREHVDQQRVRCRSAKPQVKDASRPHRVEPNARLFLNLANDRGGRGFAAGDLAARAIQASGPEPTLRAALEQHLASRTHEADARLI